MREPQDSLLHKEIIVAGSLEHFQGFMEFEQLTNPTYAGYIYDNELSVDVYGPISGTTSHKKASMYWLVITGVNIVMDDWRKEKKEATQVIIWNHERRLQKLCEQAAILGIVADPSILLEIEDIEKKIAALKSTLET